VDRGGAASPAGETPGAVARRMVSGAAGEGGGRED
jgi:hypothetical protein